MKKTIYEVPQLRLYEVKLEANVLTLSGGSSQAPNVQSLDEEDIYSGAAW